MPIPMTMAADNDLRLITWGARNEPKINTVQDGIGQGEKIVAMKN